MSTGQAKPTPPLQKPPGYRDPRIPIKHPPPPRKPVNLPPSFHHNKRRSSCCRTCCCSICIITAILILVFISAVAFFYIWFQPRLPEIHLKSITFAKFNVRKTPDGPELDAESTVWVEIKNPNQKLGVVYDKTRVSLSAGNGDTNLGEQTLPGFSQGKNNVTTLKLEMKVGNEVLDDKSAGELKKGFRSKNLLVNAEVKTGIGLKGSGWRTCIVPVKVLCEGMGSSGGGSMPKCRIMLLDWVSIN